MATTVESNFRVPALAGREELRAIPSGEAAALLSAPTLEGQARISPRTTESRVPCVHCGEPCERSIVAAGDKLFCCVGCKMVHEILIESGLGHFYDLGRNPGVRVRRPAKREQWRYLDSPEITQRLLDFDDGKTCRVTFHLPAIHCVACVWLLENLFQLHPAIGRSQVNFQRREAAISFASGKIALSELVALLASIGYEPQLTLGELEKPQPGRARQKLWLQLGVAGFAFGNIMLFSLPFYLGLDGLSGASFRALFGYLSLGLALPVLLFSASDYWRSTRLALRQRRLTLEVPIALGLAAIYVQSAVEVVLGRGGGYLDSLSGLVFFLLCGRLFQQKTHDRLAFDLDYKCFFPLSALRKTSFSGLAHAEPLQGHESVALSEVRVGDRLLVRNGELIPADARLASGPALVDYSFVTGESEPVPKVAGDYLYAGGQQVGGAIEVETVKPVSQSYLISLWNHEAFRKDREDSVNTLTNRYARRFTRVVIGMAVGAALYWLIAGNYGRALKAFTSVLIVACPCALALAAPFALGTAQRLLARIGVFLKNTLVLERMSRVDSIVFDKTGTLTNQSRSEVSFYGQRSELSCEEASWICSLAKHSTHPHAIRIGAFLENELKSTPGPSSIVKHLQVGERTTGCPSCDKLLSAHSEETKYFVEEAGKGIEGVVEGHRVVLGSRSWLESRGVEVPESGMSGGSEVMLALDGRFRGVFLLKAGLRGEIARMSRALSTRYQVALLSGDNERERERFEEVFGSRAVLSFNQTPLDKLTAIRRQQEQGMCVMMVGDGLNDAGALKQSDVGIAVVEKVGVFSPASDIILAAEKVARLSEILGFARGATRIVRASFVISAAYNLVGIGIAAAGVLSPLICAVLMPLSSVSVVLFACGAAKWSFERYLCRTSSTGQTGRTSRAVDEQGGVR